GGLRGHGGADQLAVDIGQVQRVLAQDRDDAEAEGDAQLLQDPPDLRLPHLEVGFVVEVHLVDGAAGGDDQQLFHSGFPAIDGAHILAAGRSGSAGQVRWPPRPKRAARPGQLASSTITIASTISSSANTRTDGSLQASMTPWLNHSSPSTPDQKPARRLPRSTPMASSSGGPMNTTSAVARWPRPRNHSANSAARASSAPPCSSRSVRALMAPTSWPGSRPAVRARAPAALPLRWAAGRLRFPPRGWRRRASRRCGWC